MKYLRENNFNAAHSGPSLNCSASWVLVLVTGLLIPLHSLAGTTGTTGVAGAAGTVTGGNGTPGGPGGPGVIFLPGVSTNNNAYAGGIGGAGGAGGAVAGTAPIATGGSAGSGGSGGAGAVVTSGILTNNNILAGGTGGTGGAGGASSTTAVIAVAIGGNGAGGGDGGAGVTLGTGSILNNTSFILGAAGGTAGAGGAAVSTTGAAQGGSGGVGGTGATGVTVANNDILGNSGTISGGTGGAGGAGGSGTGAGGTGLGGPGGNGGAGGVGVALGLSATLVDSGTISGGNGSTIGGAAGAGDTSGPAGIGGLGGVAITGIGSDTVTDSGTIQAGTGQNDAIEFSNGANQLILQAGYVINGNVVSSSGNTNGGDALVLGGNINDVFNVAAIGPAAQYRGFTTYAKIGTSTWTLLNTTTEVTPWTINQGTLSIAADGSLGDDSGILTLNGGTLETTASFGSTRGVTVDNGGGTFQVDPTVTTTLSGNIIDGTGQTGSLTKTGLGTLILIGTNTYSGGTTVSAGTLQGNTTSLQGDITDNATVVFDQANAGSYGSVLSGTGSVTKQNNGTLVLTGVNTYGGGTTISAGALTADNMMALGTGSVSLNGGTLQLGSTRNLTVGNNYMQGTAGTLALRINAGGADVINVTGNADLGNGLLSLNFTGFAGFGGPGTMGSTRDYTLLTSAGLLGTTFNPAVQTTALPNGDTVQILYTNVDTDVEVQITGGTVLFPTVGLDANQQSTLVPINRGLTSGYTNVDFVTVDAALANIYASNPSAFGEALNELSPEKFEYFASQTAFNNASFETQAMDNYLAGQRGANGDFIAGNGKIDASGLTVNDPNYDPSLAMVHSRLLAWNPGPLSPGLMSDSVNPLLGGMDMKSMAQPEYTNPWDFFVRGNVILAQGFSQQDVPHFDDNTESVVLGTDYHINKNFLVGLTAGYGHTDVTLDHNGSSATADSYSPGLYASYADHGWYSNVRGQYLHNAYTQDRNVAILGQTAHSAPEGNQGEASWDGGYEFHRGAFIFGPIAGLQYTHLSVDGFTESGSAADLNVASNDSDSLRSRFGGTFSYAYNYHGTTITPHLNATWQHEFMDQSRGIDSQFGFGGGSFAVRTPTPSRDSALVDLGVTADLNRTVSVFTDYMAQAGQDNYFGQSVQAGLKIGF